MINYTRAKTPFDPQIIIWEKNLMNSSDLMDTPRIFTAIAEWAACMIYILLLPKKLHQYKLGFSLTGTLGVLLLYQYIAGLLPLYLWIPGMIGAIAIMYFSIYFICHTSFQDAAFCCIRAFVLAEFAASLQWQLMSGGPTCSKRTAF